MCQKKIKHKKKVRYDANMVSNPQSTSSYSLWEQLSNLESIKNWDKYQASDFPKVSIVVPIRQSAQLIGLTLDSILSQKYPDFEIIVVNCSDDRSLAVVKAYRNERIKVYTVTQCRRYEMLNKGIAQAEGKYLNFLFPGDYYLSHEALRYMMTLALNNQLPQLVYCGTLIRDAQEEVKILFRELTLNLLKRGQQPTSLQSCWFRADAFREIGKFNPLYIQRGGFELLCRFHLQKDFRYASSNRVLSDYDLRAVTRRMIIIHFWETLKTIYHYFGFKTAFFWLFIQKDMKRFFKLWIRSFQIAFSGRNK